jgi:hypothetical protein
MLDMVCKELKREFPRTERVRHRAVRLLERQGYRVILEPAA